jgi:hypothetical protein
VLGFVYLTVAAAMVLTAGGMALLAAVLSRSLRARWGFAAAVALLSLTLLAASALNVAPVKEVERAAPDGTTERWYVYGENPWARLLLVPLYLSAVALAASALLMVYEEMVERGRAYVEGLAAPS